MIDVSRGVALEAKYVGATPFAWGQFGGEAMTVTNQGGCMPLMDAAGEPCRKATTGSVTRSIRS
ncbi:MAG: hypothetical protein CM1200mP2_11890 [Planctomycetaceae bacterium]|nr:MAG: hypothetical protein CM1200mP2_11890 [Planctomycetaceae bacterium]